MPVRTPREVLQVRLYGVTSGYCRKRAGSDRINCDIGAVICSIWKPWLLLAASTDLIYIHNQWGKTASVGSPVCCWWRGWVARWPGKVLSALRVLQFLHKGSAITGLREVKRSQNLTLSLSCVVSYPLLEETNQPKAPADNVAINIDIFLKKGRLNDYKEINCKIWRRQSKRLWKMCWVSILEIAFCRLSTAAYGENENKRNFRDQTTACCVLQTVEMT